MRRAEQTVRRGIGTGSARRRLVPVALAAGIALIAGGCSAGQITQTSRKEPIIDGINGDVGDMAIRDAQLLFPVGEDPRYEAGDSVPLSVTLVNTGSVTDTLVEITSPSAQVVQVQGDTVIPGGTSIVATVDPRDWTDAQRQLAEQQESADASGTPGDTEDEDGENQDSEDAENQDGDQDNTTGDETSPSDQPESSANRQPLEDNVITVVLDELVNDVQAGTNLEVVFVFENAGQISLQVPLGPPAEGRPVEQNDEH
ncbi:hypothetical protein [Actinoalloteichus hymeniacidonis]|uniref:Copper(I)-binding protein n=1 Tax=Actinoalloteichus hymeniacidonis TaxID=340345 RepID=A0AAC9HL60_9PSEU|nr:hypothetical protein [Actinoalloteichus hymeniacidonis]AOS61196.1 hypothetical protein TL08_01785 [Actinoalloteichus hymeniacidonis]MBB5910803.1 hypothetical protein [Actinoalloteichus hymeniacidonis]